jgi:heme/copper-type cytochrome/quinol oxidase subunit 1
MRSLRSGFALLWLLGAGSVAAAQALAFAAPATLHDTFYVIVHPQYVIGIPAAFVLIAAVYWVLESAARLPLRRWLAWGHFGATALGVALLSVPRLMLPLIAEPERTIDPVATFALLNRVTAAGYLLIVGGMALFVLLLIDAGWRRLGPGQSLASAR